MKAWGESHVGQVRKLNEDSFFIQISPDGIAGYFVVCDGMGGAKAGDVASRLATRAFARVMDAATEKKLAERVRDAMQSANTDVWQHSKDSPDLEGMGTTMVCMAADKSELVIGNIGDSRAYLIDEEGIRQITQDHSLVGEMLERGELTPYQAQRHPSRNVITRAIGVGSRVTCDIFQVPRKDGQYILLCTDGLTGEVSEPEIYYEVFQSDLPEKACQTLIEIANSRGGHDNITVVLVAL